MTDTSVAHTNDKAKKISFTIRVSDGARYIFVSSLTFLLAFTLRDVLKSIWDHLVTKDNVTFWWSVGYQFIFFFVLFVVLMAIALIWKNNRTYELNN